MLPERAALIEYLQQHRCRLLCEGGRTAARSHHAEIDGISEIVAREMCRNLGIPKLPEPETANRRRSR